MKSKRTAEPSPLLKQLPASILEHRLLTDAAVQELTGLTRKQRLRLEKARQFPLPIRITQKIRLYPSAQVMRWIESRQSAAQGEPA